MRAIAGVAADVVALTLLAHVVVGPLAALVERLARRMRGDQAVAAVADQVLPAGLLQGLADLEVVLRLEELQQGPLQLAVAQVLGDVAPASS